MGEAYELRMVFACPPTSSEPANGERFLDCQTAAMIGSPLMQGTPNPQTALPKHPPREFSLTDQHIETIKAKK
jgi:hypothetical protein